MLLGRVRRVRKVGLGQPVVRIPEGLGGGLRTRVGESVPRVERGEEGGELGVEGLGKVDAAQNLPPAAPAALASASPLLSTGWLCAPRRFEFFLGRGERVLKPERVPAGRLAGRAGNGGTLSFRRL